MTNLTSNVHSIKFKAEGSREFDGGGSVSTPSWDTAGECLQGKYVKFYLDQSHSTEIKIGDANSPVYLTYLSNNKSTYRLKVPSNINKVYF